MNDLNEKVGSDPFEIEGRRVLGAQIREAKGGSQGTRCIIKRFIVVQFAWVRLTNSCNQANRGNLSV